MSAQPPQQDAVVLSPSEIVVLLGEQFAGEAKSQRVKLPDGSAVDAPALAIAAMTAAILANEQAGVLRLDVTVTERRRLFGRQTIRRLGASSGGSAVAWPDGSYESRLAETLGDGSSIAVHDLVFKVMPAYDRNPWALTVNVAYRALARRGLLEMDETPGKVTKLYVKDPTVRGFRVTQRLTDALAVETPAPVQELLTGCEQGRPDVWELLVRDVTAGLEALKESPDRGVDLSDF